ncbi:zinc finger CCHC domain-containing protein 24-like [Sycon ciliatum]|uniref:zinc finger CCHC domain-containing protein 24-like n=1 Tax=Sycon ciliatum TaxID=27933 RepID=UPI0031F6F3CB
MKHNKHSIDGRPALNPRSLYLYIFLNPPNKIQTVKEEAYSLSGVRMSAPGGKGLTPYQGKRRTWGEFRCSCGKRWSSGNSWRDTWQRCQSCAEEVYPYEQRPLEPSTDPDRGVHDQRNCGKCIRMGRCCRDR